MRVEKRINIMIEHRLKKRVSTLREPLTFEGELAQEGRAQKRRQSKRTRAYTEEEGKIIYQT